MSEDEAVAAVVEAWTNAGSHPVYHREMQARLAVEWPVLHDAIRELVEARR